LPLYVWLDWLLPDDVLLLAAGLRYAGGADLATFEPAAGFTAVPFDVLVVLLTFVAVVLVAATVLPTVEPLLTALPVALLLTTLFEAGELETAAELRLILLLMLAPPLSELPPAASLSEPV
jgi:hypothetical protein